MKLWLGTMIFVSSTIGWGHSRIQNISAQRQNKAVLVRALFNASVEMEFSKFYILDSKGTRTKLNTNIIEGKLKVVTFLPVDLVAGKYIFICSVLSDDGHRVEEKQSFEVYK